MALDDWRLRRQQTKEVDDAVAGGHEQRQVVHPVAVDAPDERAEDLEARGDRDARPHLGALVPRRFQRGEVEDQEGQEPEQVLLPERSDLAVGEKP